MHLSNLHQTLNILPKRWLSWVMNFRSLKLRKMWLDKWLKRPVWDDPSTGNRGNGLKHWFNLNGISFTIFVDHCEKKMSWKKSLAVTCKVFRLFIKTLIADDKYSLLSWDNSMQTIQMHLSEKQKTFCQLMYAFLKFTSNFEHF